jgi:hypothetical protein
MAYVFAYLHYIFVIRQKAQQGDQKSTVSNIYRGSTKIIPQECSS